MFTILVHIQTETQPQSITRQFKANPKVEVHNSENTAFLRDGTLVQIATPLPAGACISYVCQFMS